MPFNSLLLNIHVLFTFGWLFLSCCVMSGSIKLCLGRFSVELNFMLTQKILEFFHREVSQVE